MIHFVCGKPRSGKGVLVMKRFIWDKLVNSDALIQTNMVLRYDRLQELLDVGEHKIHVRDRVRHLSDEEAKEWYRHFEYHTLEQPEGKEGEIDYSPVFHDPRYYVGDRKSVV